MKWSFQWHDKIRIFYLITQLLITLLAPVAFACVDSARKQYHISIIYTPKGGTRCHYYLNVFELGGALSHCLTLDSKIFESKSLKKFKQEGGTKGSNGYFQFSITTGSSFDFIVCFLVLRLVIYDFSLNLKCEGKAIELQCICCQVVVLQVFSFTSSFGGLLSHSTGITLLFCLPC